MYCSSCGASVVQGLSYCNFCGAKLSGEKGDSLIKTTELRAESLIISAMVGLFVLGLLAITVLMGVMKAVLNLKVNLIKLLICNKKYYQLIENFLKWRW